MSQSQESLFDLEPVEPTSRGRIEQPHKGVDLSELPPALFDVQRPAYHIPSLAEILAMPKHGLVAVSTFSGCGGSSLGLKWSGWTIPYAVEFIPAARECYLANFPDAYVDDRDVRLIQPRDILDTIGLQRGELDLLEGSPPCSSFSQFNRRKGARFGKMKVKDYSEGVKQTTDDLFDEWLRLVRGLLPRAILAENVPGLAQSPDAVEFYEHILRELDAIGYNVTTGIYSAGHYGSATTRKRLIINGIRKDVGPAVQRPPRLPWTPTLGEALAALPVELPEDELEHSRYRDRAADDYAELAIGQEHFWRKSLVRSAPSKPLQGITAGGAVRDIANPSHWDEARKFTATEAKWVFGYPADFTLTGTPEQRYERVARSVCPPLYLAHGRVIADALRRAAA